MKASNNEVERTTGSHSLAASGLCPPLGGTTNSRLRNDEALKANSYSNGGRDYFVGILCHLSSP
jgi:hypothetical protein